MDKPRPGTIDGTDEAGREIPELEDGFEVLEDPSVNGKASLAQPEDTSPSSCSHSFL